MNEQKWTPGKWKSYECEDITYWPGLDAGNFSVIIWGGKDSNLGVQGNTLEEARANAHLIAAAPDLYEALEAAFNHLDYDKDEETYMMVHDALAKARGETQ